jgi:hypothetical protein
VVRTGIGQIRILFDIVFNPQNLIESSSRYTDQSILNRLRIFISVTIFFILNVIIYALPLSLSEIGFIDGTRLELLLNNSGIIIASGFLTYSLYHSGVWLMRGSGGLISSYRIVMINTSIYLAIIFNLLWFGTEQETLRRLFNWTFQEFFLIVADYLGIYQEISEDFSGFPTTTPNSAMLEPSEVALIIGVIISLCYYLYVLYLGTRRVHNLTRYESMLVAGFVFTSVPTVFATTALILGVFLDLPPLFQVG